MSRVQLINHMLDGWWGTLVLFFFLCYNNEPTFNLDRPYDVYSYWLLEPNIERQRAHINNKRVLDPGFDLYHTSPLHSELLGQLSVTCQVSLEGSPMIRIVLEFSFF